MTSNIDGWAWIEHPGADGEESGGIPDDGEEAVVMAFARCFRSADGQRVLLHLRRMTLDRTVGPTTSDGVLRYLEGQRALVAHILSLVARGTLNQ